MAPTTTLSPAGRDACIASERLTVVGKSSFVATSVPAKLPHTTASRLAQSRLSTEKVTPEKTLLYLAYGSNLSSKAFRDMRGIKPLSAVNVHVPSLELTFDLSGLPYLEPCFANSGYRKTDFPSNKAAKNTWQKGLVGVVYEVTAEDFHHIIATEGGGASYLDVIVPCYVIPPGTNFIEDTPSGSPFKAHTLLQPADSPLGHRRPSSTHAQASLRYLTLIRNGAEEHGLPAEYCAFLYSLKPYTISTFRQSLGKAFMMSTWGPVFLLVRAFAPLAADKDGRFPRWFVIMMALIFKTMWMSYDIVLKKLFGEGERSLEDADDSRHLLLV